MAPHLPIFPGVSATPTSTTRSSPRSCARGQMHYPSLVRLTSLAQDAGRPRRLARHDRARSGSHPPRGVGRRQHARGRARRFERRARRSPRTRCALHLEPDALDLPAPIIERMREVLFYVVPRISPDGAECVLQDRPLGALACRATQRVERGHAALDARATSTAMASRSRCASRIQAASSSRAREFPGLLVERTLEDEGPFYKVYPRGPDRALRRQDDPVAVLPRRQPDRSQPQLPVVVGARRTSRSAPARSRRASPRRAASSSSRPRIPRSSRGATTTRSAAC